MRKYDISENAYFKKSQTTALVPKDGEEQTTTPPTANIDLDKYSKTAVRKRILVYARDKHQP